MIARILRRMLGANTERITRTTPRFTFEKLERREVLAASIGFDAATGLITITGSGFDDQAFISDLGNGNIQVDIVGVDTQQFARTGVTSILFNGGNGDDAFFNNTDVPSTARGHRGNDRLSGGAAADTMYGGPGNDILDGNDGNDFLAGGGDSDDLSGGAGDDNVVGGFDDDLVRGDSGNDNLAGDWGNDTLYGGDGADYMLGFSGNDVLYGESGDDLMYGQHGSDEVHGQGGDDRVRGGPDADLLYGGDGNDYMMGDQSDDLMYGGAGSDTALGFTGNDTIEGEDGDDFLYGQDGNDTLDGGNGHDVATGGAGDDRLHGGAGDDRLLGQDGNDWLRGDSGRDVLRGGSGDDSLFGGAAAEPDTLFGEADDDRFLVRSDDVIADQTGDDAALAFEDVSSTWTDGEIEVFDLGFQRLQDRTGNTALLRDPLIPDLLTFYKYDDLGGSAGLNYLSWTSSTTCGPSGCNTTYVYTREIRIADWDENIPFYNDQFQSIAMHEIGHNWDSELELSSASPALGGLWNNFLTISDWQENYPGAGYTQSLDGNWWYLSTANFAENYGRNNPNEDFSTSLEYYFTEYQDPSLDHSDLQSKMDLLDALFDNLM